MEPDSLAKMQAGASRPIIRLPKLCKNRPDLKVVDLGCGTGELTRQLADALPGSEVTGLDQSTEMLKKAAQYTNASLRFEHGDQAQLNGTWDLIFSNAALQWSEDHETLFSNLFSKLNPGGQLAV